MMKCRRQGTDPQKLKNDQRSFSRFLLVEAEAVEKSPLPHPCTQAHLSERKDRVQRANQVGRPAEMSLWKRARCQTESKANEKSIVGRIVRKPGLGLLTHPKWTEKGY